jgi:hypothetical protein
MWRFASCPTNSGPTGIVLLHDIPQTKTMMTMMMMKSIVYKPFPVELRIRYLNAIFSGNFRPYFRHISILRPRLQYCSG